MKANKPLKIIISLCTHTSASLYFFRNFYQFQVSVPNVENKNVLFLLFIFQTYGFVMLLGIESLILT